MDHIDKIILNHIQKDFPLTSRPYLDIALKIGITEQEAIERIKKLKGTGVVRRLGAIFDSQKLGYVSTLCALKVPEDQIREVADLINSYPGVTHNYLRNHDYNMWFTCIAPSIKHIDIILDEIRNKTGLNDLINLPSINIFKIGVNFTLKEDCR